MPVANLNPVKKSRRYNAVNVPLLESVPAEANRLNATKMNRRTAWIWFGVLSVVVLFVFFVRIQHIEISVPSGPTNPLFEALERNGSLDDFIRAVHSHSNMVNRGILLNHTNYPKWTTLAYCAASLLTNHVVVLIEHGADIDEAIAFLKKLQLRENPPIQVTEGLEFLQSLKAVTGSGEGGQGGHP